jgi:hypothetical protein
MREIGEIAAEMCFEGKCGKMTALAWVAGLLLEFISLLLTPTRSKT